jgi:PPOX class probable FMN-dependent enzyme
MSDGDRVKSLSELEALYSQPGETSLAKETPHLTSEYRRMIEASPFVVVSTVGEGGLDSSPRGDAAPVVEVLDDRTLALPDRRGNNRLDTLKNIVTDPRIGLLFFIPGCNETLRINGRAHLSTCPEMIGRFEVDGKAPVTVVIIAIETVYFQCARALIRSELWNPGRHVDRSTLPTAGQMTKAALPEFDADEYDDALPKRQADTLY